VNGTPQKTMHCNLTMYHLEAPKPFGGFVSLVMNGRKVQVAGQIKDDR
jgi:hypothetical protein